MDELYRTPLLDCFRRGEVAPDIRMLAAQGVLAPRAHEQLGLLILLIDDAGPAIRAAAAATIGRIPPAVLSGFLGRSDVPDEIRTFFQRRGIQPDPSAPAPSDEPLIEADHEAFDPDADAAARGPSRADGESRESPMQRLSRLNVTQRIKAAMRGSREERAILIRDPNRLVSLAVLSSPKVAEQEIEAFAKMASISEDALRVIGTSRSWVKNYSIVRSLAFNPKTPVAISMGFVSRLVEKDVRGLAADRNIPEPVKVLARKILQAGQSRKY